MHVAFIETIFQTTTVTLQNPYEIGPIERNEEASELSRSDTIERIENTIYIFDLMYKISNSPANRDMTFGSINTGVR